MGIRALARQLGLSIGTVSRALNDRPDVSEATRARVKEAAARIGYVPDQSGRSLRKGRTGMVAAVIPTRGMSPSAEAMFLKVLEGVRRTLLRSQLDLIVLFRGPTEDPLDHLHRVVSRHIADGILITEVVPDDMRMPFLTEAGVDFVALGRDGVGSDDYPWVDFDFEDIAHTAARHFAEAGHRRLVAALSDLPLNYNTLLAARFIAAASAAGLGPDAVQVWRIGPAGLAPAHLAALSGPDAATGFLTGNETIAASIYTALAAAGRSVGRETAVINALPTLTLQPFAPPLASFETDLDAVGVALARHLTARLSERSSDRRNLPPDRVALRFQARGSESCRRLALPIRA